MDRVPGVILGQGAVDEQFVQRPGTFVRVAGAEAGGDHAGNEPVMNPALRMRVEGEVVTLAPQLAEKFQRREFPGGHQIALMHGVDVGVSFEQFLGGAPANQHVNLRGGKIGAQLMDQRRGEQGVAIAGKGDDQQFHAPCLSFTAA